MRRKRNEISAIFYRQHGMRNVSQLLRPPLSDLETLQLPVNSAYHYVTTDEEDGGVSPDDQLLNGYANNIVVDHIVDMPIQGLRGEPHSRTFNDASYVQEFHRRYKNFKRLASNAQAVRNQRMLYVVNYAPLAKHYRYLPLLHTTSLTIGGQPALVLRTEETGEQDLEILLPADAVVSAWEQLMAAGATFGIKAVGSQARELLRIEAGLPKAGPDLNEEIVPPEANLEGKAFSLSKGCYPGQEVVARMDTYGNVRRHLVGLRIQDVAVPPRGAKLFSGDREVGWISSAIFSPTRNAVLAFGFPLRDFSTPDTVLAVEVAGTRHPAIVHALPFYSRR
jgi:folate-binding protein YgfZ